MDCLNQIYTIGYGITAEWQSGHAADCKSVYAGSIPNTAKNYFNNVELVLKKDLAITRSYAG